MFQDPRISVRTLGRLEDNINTPTVSELANECQRLLASCQLCFIFCLCVLCHVFDLRACGSKLLLVHANNRKDKVLSWIFGEAILELANVVLRVHPDSELRHAWPRCAASKKLQLQVAAI